MECLNSECKFKGTKKFKGERSLMVHQRSLMVHLRSCRPDLFESLKRQRAEATERKDSKRPRSELQQPADPLGATREDGQLECPNPLCASKKTFKGRRGLMVHLRSCQPDWTASPPRRKDPPRPVSNAPQQTTQTHEGAADTNGLACPNSECKFKDTKKFKGERGLMVHLRSCKPDLIDSIKRHREEASEGAPPKETVVHLLTECDGTKDLAEEYRSLLTEAEKRRWCFSIALHTFIHCCVQRLMSERANAQQPQPSHHTYQRTQKSARARAELIPTAKLPDLWRLAQRPKWMMLLRNWMMLLM
eukprot:Tbor_TRINITY_DN5855_c1_g1::TRINITY_DN5855_c1_g1_i5::g.6399::m.6399